MLHPNPRPENCEDGLDSAKAENPSIHTNDKIDIGDRPRFTCREAPAPDRAGMVVPYVGLLVLYNLVFFVAGYVSFLRYDVR